jgi:hypothetical protein
MNDTEDFVGAGLFEAIASWFLMITPTDRQVRRQPDRFPHDGTIARSGSDNSIAPDAQDVEQSLEVGSW